MGGGVHRDNETLTLSAAHTLAAYTVGVPRALKCFALASLDQQELFNFPSKVLFCTLEVWQDFIRTVVPRLLSRGTNFHSNKNIRNYTQDAYGLVNFRFHT